MEHRWSARKSMTTSVVVDCARLGTVSADIRDVSLGGMFVKTAINSPVNSIVILAFSLPTQHHHDHYRLQAIVVRRADEGLALMFQDLQTETIRSLRQSLYGPNGSGSNWPATRAA